MIQQACDEDLPTESWGKGVTFYFLCDDVDVVFSEIQTRNIEISNPETAFYGMKQLFIQDPDGYQLCFESKVE